ncbi:MAG TPA: hypothetical protein VNR39_19190 [Pseudolabrys sp.]|nr:hypothetical protein [Pseudolabrys sp.]
MTTDGDFWRLLGAFIGGSVVSYLIQLSVGYFSRPQLKLVTKKNSGLLVLTPGVWVREGAPPIPEEFKYIRALVENRGRSSAKGCIAYVTKVIWVDRAGQEHVYKEMDLIELKWAWRGHGTVEIPRGSYQYIDIFHLWRSVLGSRFSSDRFPGYLSQWGAGGGRFFISLKVCSENALPVDGLLSFEWDGTWDEIWIVE